MARLRRSEGIVVEGITARMRLYQRLSGVASIGFGLAFFLWSATIGIGAVIFGTPFMLVGAIVVGAFRRHRIDGKRGVIHYQWGVFFPFHDQAIDLGAFNAVHLASLTVGTTTRYAVYPIRLTGRSDVSLIKLNDYMQARRLGEKVSRATGHPLVDVTRNPPQRRIPDELDLSIREQLSRAGIRPKLPDAPRGSRIELRRSGDRAVMHIPGSFSSGGAIVSGLVALLATVVLAYLGEEMLAYLGKEMLAQEPDTIVALLMVLLLALILVLLALLGFARAVLPRRIDVSPESLRFRFAAGLLGRWTIAAENVEELLAGDGWVEVMTDDRRERLDLATGSSDDVAFVRGVLVYYLGSPN